MFLACLAWCVTKFPLCKQPLDLAPEIFIEAAAARGRLDAGLLGAPLDAAVLDPRIGVPSVAFEEGEEVPSGMVAEALALMAAGELDVRPGMVKVLSLFLLQAF
jgi:hypothetical protein